MSENPFNKIEAYEAEQKQTPPLDDSHKTQAQGSYAGKVGFFKTIETIFGVFGTFVSGLLSVFEPKK